MSSTVNEGAAPAPAKKKSSLPEGNKEKPWTPKMWSGMRLGAWLSLLARNRFAIGWQRIGMALIITLFSVSNSLLSVVQNLVFGRRLKRVKIHEQPIFIIGHWRSGTTFLHELMALDPRHTYPTTYECFSPNHFLLTERVFARWLSFLLPTKRLQDNVPMGWNKPQEDEFALCNLGERSPFLTCAFPNRPPQDMDYLFMDGLPPEKVRRWQESLRTLLTRITFRRPRRIVLKSPQHTPRIKALVEAFPDARFVYIVRDPFAVFPSTMKLWKLMYASQGLQAPTFAGLEEHVLDTFARMHETVERTRGLVPANRFSEVRYEELVRDPVGQLRRIYGELELDGFESVVPALEGYLTEVKDYQTNRYDMPAATQETIRARWRAYLEKYGYDRAD